MQPLEEQETELTAMPLEWHVFRYSKKKLRAFVLPLQLGWGEPMPLMQIESEAESLAEKITKEFGKGTYCALAYPRQRTSLVGAIPLLIQHITVADLSARYVLIPAKLREFVGEQKLFPSWQDLTPLNLASNLWQIAGKCKSQAASQSVSTNTLPEKKEKPGAEQSPTTVDCLRFLSEGLTLEAAAVKAEKMNRSAADQAKYDKLAPKLSKRLIKTKVGNIKRNTKRVQARAAKKKGENL